MDDVIKATKENKLVRITEQDLLNNPGVASEQIAEVKSQYHFHKLSFVTLTHHTLHCTFAPDPNPSSIFYTPFEEGKEPVREYEVGEVKGEVELMPDGLAVRVGEKYISSEEIWAQGAGPGKKVI